MKVFIVSAVLVACALAAPMDTTQENSSVNNVFKFFGSCMESEDYSTCLAVKGITALSRAARAANIEVTSGVTFVRDPNAPSERLGKAISENEITSSLPADPQEKSGRLLDMAVDSATKFMQTHTLQFKLPAEVPEQVARSLEEGRGKLKKIIKGPLGLAIIAKIVALLPLLLIGVKFLAIKALVTAKIALILAAMLIMNKMFAGGASTSPLNLLSKVAGGFGGGATAGTTAAGWSSAGAPSAQYPYARSYDDAQELAYSAQVPQQ